MKSNSSSLGARTRQLLPRKSFAHRIACLALYRALLEQSTRVPLPADLPPSGPVNPLKHLIRKRFRSDAAISSPRLAANALRVGYAAEHLLRTAGDSSPAALSKIHDLLRLRASRSAASRLACAPTPQREASPRVDPYPGAAKLLDVRPLPVEQLSGRRRVPVLTQANGFPFLRVRRPQSAFLGRVLRDKIEVKDRRHKMLQGLDEELSNGDDERVWDGLVGALVEDEGKGSGRGRRREASWVDEPLKTKERLKRAIWEDLDKAQKLGARMMEIVEKEKVLWKQEREVRRSEKKAAKREGKRTGTEGPEG